MGCKTSQTTSRALVYCLKSSQTRTLRSNRVLRSSIGCRLLIYSRSRIGCLRASTQLCTVKLLSVLQRKLSLRNMRRISSQNHLTVLLRTHLRQLKVVARCSLRISGLIESNSKLILREFKKIMISIKLFKEFSFSFNKEEFE